VRAHSRFQQTRPAKPAPVGPSDAQRDQRPPDRRKRVFKHALKHIKWLANKRGLRGSDADRIEEVLDGRGAMRGSPGSERGGRDLEGGVQLHALDLDPHLAMAFQGLGWTHYGDVMFQWTDSQEHSLAELVQAARRCVALDDKSAYGHWLLGVTSRLTGQQERAISLTSSQKLCFLI